MSNFNNNNNNNNYNIDNNGNDIGTATANGINLEKNLAEIKECNYTLVNSITATEAIQKEKETLESEFLKTATIKDEKRIKKLQYNISLQSEALMKTLMKLDSITISGHIKHSHKIKKERKREKQLQQQFEDEFDLSSDSRSRSGSSSTANTSSSNFTSSDSESSDSSDSESDSSENEYIPKFSPHKLRKYRKQLVNRIMRLIDYLDVLSNETKDLKKRFEESKVNNTAPVLKQHVNEQQHHHQQQYQAPGYHQHKNERKQQPTIGQNRNNRNRTINNSNDSNGSGGSFNNNNNSNHSNNNSYEQDQFRHQRQSSYDFNSPFEFKEFNANNDELHPFGEEEENNFDDDNFESPASALNRYRSKDNFSRVFRRF